MLYFAVGVLAIAGIFFYARYAANYSKNFAQIGVCAAQTYIMFGDPAAFCAARTVCASMSESHSKQLLGMFALIPISAEDTDELAAKDRRSMLVTKAGNDSRDMSFSVAMKIELKQQSENWLVAVMKRDLNMANRLFKEASISNAVNVLRSKNQG